jgi:hypothetical protein
MKRTVSKQPNTATRDKMEEKDSFPASDPVSLIQPGPPEPLAKSSNAGGKKKPKR